MSYSKDLRECALRALRNGNSKAEVTKMFGLGTHTLWDWENLEAETGSLENRPLDRKPYKIDREKLLAYYKEHPDSTNKETAAAFSCSISGIRSAKAVIKITRKKN